MLRVSIVAGGRSMLVLLGILLIFVGFVLAVARRGMLPGTSSQGDPLAGHSATTDPRTRTDSSYFSASAIDPDAQSGRRKIVEVLAGIGLIAIGVVCVVSGM